MALVERDSKVEIRLIRYFEQSRETTRKRIWTNNRWFDTYNHRDRGYKKDFIAADAIEIPDFVKEAVTKEFISRITFTKGS